MNIKFLSAFILIIALLLGSKFFAKNDKMTNENMDSLKRSQNPRRSVSQESPPDRNLAGEVEVLVYNKREDSYFKEKILVLENSGEANSRELAGKIAGVLYEWALTSPEGAMSYVRDVIDENVYAYQLFVPAALDAWSTVDPKGSMEYVVNNPDAIPFSIEMVKGTLKAAVNHDGSLIFKNSEAMPGSWIEYVSRDLKEYFSSRGENLLLLNMVDNLPQGSEQRLASLIGLADAYAVGDDWNSSWKIASELVLMAGNEEQASLVAKTFSMTASWTDPMGFIKWVNGNVSEEHIKEQFIETAASDWATRDIVSYSGWLRNLPVEERKDSFIINVVDPIMSEDPIIALEWAALIQKPEAKQAYFSKILDRVDFGGYSKELERLVDKGVIPKNLIKK